MRSAAVVPVQIFNDQPSGFVDRVRDMEMHSFVLHRFLYIGNVSHCPSIHSEPAATIFNPFRQTLLGELAALIGDTDLECGVAVKYFLKPFDRNILVDGSSVEVCGNKALCPGRGHMLFSNMRHGMVTALTVSHAVPLEDK